MKIDFRIRRSGGVTLRLVKLLAIVFGVSLAVAATIFFATGADISGGRISAAKKEFNRATAVSIVERENETQRANVEKLAEKAFDYRVKARTMELVAEREEEQIDMLRQAIKKLCDEAKSHGLPKPVQNESLELSDEQKNVLLSFNGKELSGAEYYPVVTRWIETLDAKVRQLEAKKAMIDRMRFVAQEVVEKKDDLVSAIEKRENRLRELQECKDLAQINAELATIDANVKGIAAGKSGRAIATIQEQIDELEATAATYNEQMGKCNDVYPSDVVCPEEAIVSIDAFWDD